MNGIGPYTPGIDGARAWPTANGHRVGTACIGGADAIEPGQLPERRAMEAYAARYNRRMADYLAAHPRPPEAASSQGSSD